MEKLIIISLTTLMLIGCSSSTPDYNISGEWEWQKNDSTADFTITLKQTDNEITGSYCGIFNSGTRIDCPLEADEKNITGKFKDGLWEINYKSNYSMEDGKATIEYKKDRNILLWNNLTESNGAFCPDEGILIKK